MRAKMWERIVIAMAVCWGLVGVLTTPSAQAGTLAGSGSWSSQRFDAKGTWTVDLSRTQDNVAGGITLTGSPVVVGGNVSGVITNGNSVTLGVLENGARIATFTGRLQGTTVTGTYQAETGDQGVWSGTLTTTTP